MKPEELLHMLCLLKRRHFSFICNFVIGGGQSTYIYIYTLYKGEWTTYVDFNPLLTFIIYKYIYIYIYRVYSFKEKLTERKIIKHAE